MSDQPLGPGADFLHFKITRLLGQGGMGRVYEAEHAFLQRRIALKVMLSERVDEEMKARMVQEARALAALEHPNVVRVYDAGVAGGNIWIAMEYLEGRTLRSLRTVGGPFALGHALDVLIEICDGVAAAHEIHIVHRDLKPENVVRTTQNQIKVLDFGAAKVLRRADRVSTMADATGKKRIIGTPEYMSPEHLSGQPVDDRTDTYAIACMGYELIARHPFANPDGSLPEVYETVRRQFVEPPPPLLSLAPHVPADIAAMLERGLAKKAPERPSAAELAGFFRAARVASKGVVPSAERAPFENKWLGPGSWAAHGPAVSLPQQVTPPSDPSRRVLVQVPAGPSPEIPPPAMGQGATVSLRPQTPPPPHATPPPPPPTEPPRSPPVLAGEEPRSHATPVYAKTENLLAATPPATPPPRAEQPAPQAITIMPETTGRDPRATPPARARAGRTAALAALALASVVGVGAILWAVVRSPRDVQAEVAGDADAGAIPSGDAAASGEDAGEPQETPDAGPDAGAGAASSGEPHAAAPPAVTSSAASTRSTAAAPSKPASPPASGAAPKPTTTAKPAASPKPPTTAQPTSTGIDLPFGKRPLPPGN